MSDLDLYQIASNSYDELSTFAEKNCEFSLGKVLNKTIFVESNKITILQDTLLVINSTKPEIQEKISNLLKTIKKHRPEIDIKNVSSMIEMSLFKADLSIVPCTIEIHSIACKWNPIIKIYEESFYQKNPGKKLEAWHFIRKTLNI